MSAGAVTEPMQHRDAERFLLGAVMSGAPDLDDLFDLIDADDFYLPAHGDIWAAAARVHHSGSKPEPTSVRLALAEDESKFDPVQLFTLCQECSMPAHAPFYAELVATAAGLRRLQGAGARVSQIASTHGDLEERREQARQALDEACRGGRSVTTARKVADLLPAAIDAAQSGKTGVLSTGWNDIDRVIGGIAPGRLIVVGARPGGGKSLSGTNLALHVARHHGHSALVASLEMPENEVMNRLLAAHAEVNLTDLINGTVSDRDWDRLAAASEGFNDLPLYVDDTSDITVQGLRRLARDVQRERDDLALIVVDYLQLVRPAQRKRESSRAEEVSGIARDLKLLARETGACVVAMAQVNREGGKNTEGPRLTDLREGGAENDADVVVLLHRPNIEIAEVTAMVAKNRHGAASVAVTLELEGHYARLRSMDWRRGLT